MKPYLRNNIIISIVFILTFSNVITLLVLNKKTYKIKDQQELIHTYEGYYDNTEALYDSIDINNHLNQWQHYEETVHKYLNSKDSVDSFYL